MTEETIGLSRVAELENVVDDLLRLYDGGLIASNYPNEPDLDQEVAEAFDRARQTIELVEMEVDLEDEEEF